MIYRMLYLKASLYLNARTQSVVPDVDTDSQWRRVKFHTVLKKGQTVIWLRESCDLREFLQRKQLCVFFERSDVQEFWHNLS